MPKNLLDYLNRDEEDETFNVDPELIPSSLDSEPLPEEESTEDELQSEVDELDDQNIEQRSIPEPTIPNEQVQLSNLLQRYRDAQQSRHQGMQGANILRAADMMATGIAGPGAKRAPEEIFKGIQDQSELGVKSVEEEIKGRPLIQKVYTEEEMANPQSDVSRLAQHSAIQVYPEMKDKLEKLSASQLEKLGFKVKSPNMNMGRNRIRIDRIRDPDSGLTKLVEIDSDNRDPKTGKPTVTELGEAGYSYQSYLDPYSEERKLSRDLAAGAVTRGTPIVQTPKTDKKQELEAVEFKNNVTQAYAKLKPIHIKRLNEVAKEFSTETKPQRESFDSIDNLTENAIDLSTHNQIQAAALGAQVAGIYENGKLTDEDVMRYTRRNGVVSRLTDAAQMLLSGTITKEKAAELKEALRDYKEGLRGKLSERSLEKARSLIPALNAQGIDVDPRYLSPSIYGNYDDNVHKISKKKPRRVPGELVETPKGKFRVGPDGYKLIRLGK